MNDQPSSLKPLLPSFARRFAACALLLVSMLSANVASALPVARLRHVRPVTMLRHKKARAFIVARERNSLSFGSVVRTGNGGKANVLFSNGTRIVLRERSQLQIVSASSPNQPLVVRLFGALSQAFVKPQGDTRIVTNAAVAAAKGTAFTLRLADENTTELTVVEGEVEFGNSFGRVDVFANQRSSAQVGRAPTAPVAVDASGETQWTADVNGLPVSFEWSPAFDEPQTRVVGQLIRARRYSEARALLQVAPDEHAVWLARSCAARLDGDAPNARAHAQNALQSAQSPSQEREARLVLALAHLASDDDAEAQAALREPKFASTFDGAANALPMAVTALCEWRAGESERALRTLNDALKRDNCAQTRSLLALVLLSRGDNASALSSARAATKRAPNLCMAQATLAMTLFFSPVEKERREALRVADLALKLNPESPFALLAQGRALFARGQIDRARDVLQTARAFAPDLPLLDLELGQAYLRADQNPRAERAFRRALSKRADDANARAGLGLALAQQGKYAQARQEYERALELAPDNALARGNFALLLIERGELDAARQQLERGLGDGPDSGLIYARLSEVSLYQNRLVDAGDYARRAVELLPNSSLARYQLGRVFLEQERIAQAEEQFRQAVTLDPLNARARYALGLTRERVALGLEPTRPLGSAAGANFAGAAQALSVQNLQTPGVSERVQAALQDPTVVRSASRSFGDFQLNARRATSGAEDYEASFLRESDDRRGVFGLTGQRVQRDGPRARAERKDEQIGFSIGRKAGDSSAGFFALGQYRTVESSGDFDEVSDPINASRRTRARVPFLLLGGTLGERRNERTRALFAVDSLRFRLGGADGFTNTDGRSAHGEVRHDRVFGRHLLSIGAAFGRRRFADRDLLSDPEFPDEPPLSLSQTQTLQRLLFYARDEWQPTSRLRVTGELRLERLRTNYNIAVDGETVPASNASPSRLLPNLIVEYRLDRVSSLRLQAREVFGSVEDFALLAPTDVFLQTVVDSLPPLLGERGTAFTLQYDRTFGSRAFLRLGAFSQRVDNGIFALDAPEQLTSVKGFVGRFEATLHPTTTLFLGADINDVQTTIGGVSARTSDVPRFTSEVGLQFLAREGWFVQPSFAYLGRRATGQTDGRERGGVGLLNLRAGRRLGLRASAFVEVSNLTNRRYATTLGLADKRRVRAGIVQRF